MLEQRNTGPATDLEAPPPAFGLSRSAPLPDVAEQVVAEPAENVPPSAVAAASIAAAESSIVEPVPSRSASRAFELKPPDDPAPAPPATVESHFWLTRRDQLLLAALTAVMLALLAVHWLRLTGWSGRPIEIERLPSRAYEFRIDVNKATWVEWTQLEGVGDALARRIVEDRRSNGPFRSIADLQRVRGIGPKTVERLKPWLRIGGEP